MIGDLFSKSLRDVAEASKRAADVINALAAEMRRQKPRRQWRNHPQRRLHK
jgi:hypothetical protein